MEDAAATSREDYIDIAALRILDLRTLGQDEIRCLAHLCGNVPARLQDLVNVIIDKSVFNESAGSKRQTFDRDRLPRNKERRLSTGPASAAQLHLAIESAGLSHKDLILHLCRQLKIEKGDRALFDAQALQEPSGASAEVSRPMSLKRMARASASFEGRADSASVPLSKTASDLFVNGKEVAMAVLHRSKGKMKTKDEARRRASESQAGAEASHDLQEEQEQKQALLAIRSTSLYSDEANQHEDIPSGVLNPTAQIQKDLQSSEFTGVSAERRPRKRMKILCKTCERSFCSLYSLRRHTTSAGHISKMQMVQTLRKKKKDIPKTSLVCSCGNTYGSVYTLKRHAVKRGHPVKMLETTNMPEMARPSNDQGEEKGDNVGFKLGKEKRVAFSPDASFKSNVRLFSCRFCHRQFKQKQHFIRHMDTHLKRARKKTGKSSHLLLQGRLAATSNEFKVRLGRPPKLDRMVPPPMKKKRGRPKRKLDSEPVERQVKFRKGEDSSWQTIGHISSEVQSLTCQECGKMFDKFNSYTGHLSVHSKKRKGLAGRTSNPPSATIGKNVLQFKESTVIGHTSSEKGQTLTCQECGKMFDKFSSYTGHLSMHAKKKNKGLVGPTSKPPIDTIRKNVLKFEELTSVGFRKLLSDKAGTYLSGLPAKLLFSESDLPTKQNDTH